MGASVVGSWGTAQPTQTFTHAWGSLHRCGSQGWRAHIWPPNVWDWKHRAEAEQSWLGPSCVSHWGFGWWG